MFDDVLLVASNYDIRSILIRYVWWFHWNCDLTTGIWDLTSSHGDIEPAKFGDLSTNCNKENYNRNVTCQIKMISRIHSIQINLIVGKFLTDVISGTCVFPVCIFLLGRCKGKHTTHIHTLSIWIDVHPSLWNVFDAVPSVISHSRFMRQGLTFTAWRGKVTWWVNK